MSKSPRLCTRPPPLCHADCWPRIARAVVHAMEQPIRPVATASPRSLPRRGQPPHPLQQPCGHPVSAATSCVRPRGAAAPRDPMVDPLPDSPLPLLPAPSDDAGHCHKPAHAIPLTRRRQGQQPGAATTSAAPFGSVGSAVHRDSTLMAASAPPRDRRRWQPRPWVSVMVLGWAAGCVLSTGASGHAMAHPLAPPLAADVAPTPRSGPAGLDHARNASPVTIPTAVPPHPRHTDSRARRQGGHSIELNSHDPDPIIVSKNCAVIPYLTPQGEGWHIRRSDCTPVVRVSKPPLQGIWFYQSQTPKVL